MWLQSGWPKTQDSVGFKRIKLWATILDIVGKHSLGKYVWYYIDRWARILAHCLVFFSSFHCGWLDHLAVLQAIKVNQSINILFRALDYIQRRLKVLFKVK